MKYFTKSMTLDEVKAAYRKQALRLHPNMGGSVQAMQQLNIEFEIAFALAKRTAPQQTTETAQSYQKEFYTQRGWNDSCDNGRLTTKEVAQIVREYIKDVYPTYKFSVTKTAKAVNVALMEYPEKLTNNEIMQKYIKNRSRRNGWYYVPSAGKNIEAEELTDAHIEELIKWEIKRVNTMQLGCFVTQCKHILTPEVMVVLSDIDALLNVFNKDIIGNYNNIEHYHTMNLGKQKD